MSNRPQYDPDEIVMAAARALRITFGEHARRLAIRQLEKARHEDCEQWQKIIDALPENSSSEKLK